MVCTQKVPSWYPLPLQSENTEGFVWTNDHTDWQTLEEPDAYATWVSESQSITCFRGWYIWGASSRIAVTVSASEVEKHATDSDCWVVVGDVVYDVTNFLADHPGGKKSDHALCRERCHGGVRYVS